MPYFALWGTSALMVFGSFYDYTEDILDRTDGGNYKGMFYATQLAWIPVFITSTMHMFVDNDMAWQFTHMAMWEAAAGPIAYNWFGLGWAQYQRSIQGTTDFTSSDNLTSLGINFGWNILSMFWTWKVIAAVDGMESQYRMREGDAKHDMMMEKKEWC